MRGSFILEMDPLLQPPHAPSAATQPAIAAGSGTTAATPGAQPTIPNAPAVAVSAASNTVTQPNSQQLAAAPQPATTVRAPLFAAGHSLPPGVHQMPRMAPPGQPRGFPPTAALMQATAAPGTPHRAMPLPQGVHLVRA